MPLTLPPGVTVHPISTMNLLAPGRVVDYVFDLMDNDENLLGTLDSVSPGGSLQWTSTASIKGGGSIDVTDIGADIDWLNTRIRPSILSSYVGLDEGITKTGLGIFIPSAPKETWGATGRKWSVELLDKNCILDQDLISDSAGNATSWDAPPGANVIDLIKGLIVGGGETADAIMPDPAVVPAGPGWHWDVGVSRLKIINEMLDSSNHFSLWVDGNGQYQVTKYKPPLERTPAYDLLTPFTKGNTSFMSPEWERDRDIYAVPNRVTLQGAGDGGGEGWTKTAVNIDPASPFSYPSRGRWISYVETGIEAVSSAALEDQAKRKLTDMTSVTSAISVSHIFLPDLRVNSVVRFVNPDAGLDFLCYVTSLTIPLAATDLCESEMREATTADSSDVVDT